MRDRKNKMVNQDRSNLEISLILAPNEKEAVTEFATILRQQFGPMIKEIILFGSKARGDGKQHSDIDILIVLNKLSWEIKKNISRLAAQENIKHNVLISTIRYDTDTWESPVIKLSPFGRTVRKEGIWL